MQSHVSFLSFLLLFSTSIGIAEDSDTFVSGSGDEYSGSPPPTDLAPVYETYHNKVYGNLTCEYYHSGGLCQYVIPGSLPVLTNFSRGPQNIVKDDLDKIFYVLSTFDSSEQCTNKAVQILCHFTFPYCDPSYKEVIYQPICKWDCQLMRDFICPEQWIQMMRLQSVIGFGTIDSFDCDLLSPANGGDSPMCISTFDGGKIPLSLISGNECYTGDGRGYTGNINISKSGYTCQTWSLQYPHQHYLFPQQYPELSGNHNYCRNPGGKGIMPWCFTNNRTNRWEYCNIPQCSPGGICERYNGTICSKYGTIGLEYVYINTTFGIQYDYEYQLGKLKDTLQNFEDCQLESMIELLCHVNFPTCDMSSNIPTPRKVCRSYCNITKNHCTDLYEHLKNFVSVTLTDPLIIPQCIDNDSDISSGGDNPECYIPYVSSTEPKREDCYNGTNYNGTVNITISGILCQNWNSQTPHSHPLTVLYRDDLEGHNYCRNPDGRGQQPWCYTINSSIRWEYCNIEKCIPITVTPLLSQTIIIGIIGGSVGILLLMIIIMICCCCIIQRRSKYRKVTLTNIHNNGMVMKSINNNYSIDKPIIDEKELEEYLDGNTLPYLKRNQLTYLCDLGEGHFGKVLKAEAIIHGNDKTIVAVKVLKEGTSHSARKEFFREVCLMNGYNHRNIVKLLGVCIKEEPLCMVFEYMEMGDLHSFLRQNAPCSTFSFPQNGPKTLPNGLSIDKMVYMSTDIAAGLDYLTTHHHIHRDLATRNCLVNSELCVKISDFGMSQDIYVSDYFRLGDSEMLPIRWMPPEAIMYSTFSTESDVWSFGIVLWEIFSYGMQPYYGMSNEQVVQYVKNCQVITKPEQCPQEIYDLMLDCWTIEPKERPKAKELYDGLKRWTPELSAQVKGEEKKKHDYQNMSVILQWANDNGDINHDGQNYQNINTSGRDYEKFQPYDKLSPEQDQ